MAVYAGTTLADANLMLAKVKAAGKYPSANVRRMRAAFNGT
jgi:pyruvate kinase